MNHGTGIRAISDTLHVVCPHCLTVNRVRADKLGDQPTCGRCQRALFTAEPLDLTGATFDRHVERSDVPVVVDFWAPWCGPCRAMAPQFRRAAARLEPRARLARVDTESEPALVARFGVRSIPTLVLFRSGREVARQAGAMAAPEIVRWVQSHLR